MQNKRKLTPKEKERADKVADLVSRKEKEGYIAKHMTIGMLYANVMAFVIGIPLCAPFLFLFVKCMKDTIRPMPNIFLQVFVIIGAIVVHELIHGVSWSLFTPHRFKDVEFGFMRDTLTPYCACLEPLSKGQYLFGCLMPGILLGFVPLLIGALTSSVFLLILGIIMTFSAGGDYMIALRLLFYRSENKDRLYIDHPFEAGLIVLEK